MAVVYTLMFFLYTLGAFAFMFFYWKKSMSWRYKEHQHSEPFFENDLSLHTIMVTGIPKEFTASEATKLLKEVFTEVFTEDKVVMARA